MRNKFFKSFVSILIVIASIFAITGCFATYLPEDDYPVGSAEAIEDGEASGVEESSESSEASGASETSEVSEIFGIEIDDPSETSETEGTSTSEASEPTLDVDGSYTTMEDVALYIHIYGELPSNFITKQEARNLGWSGGSLEPYAPGMCIGGDYFGNYEGLLPEASGREYHECDINTLGASSRGAERIIFSNDGLIYYTSDHYESFTLIYGEE